MINQNPMRTVAVYLVTYRRHGLLRRAIDSVLRQTHRNWRMQVVNDDPSDYRVKDIVTSLDDPRVTLLEPAKKRGATANFALVFEEADADYAALLEDDNWWEPEFLASQIDLLERHPDIPVAVGNERVWQEGADGSWTDTGRTIWPFTDKREYRFTLESLCGSAIYCNSSALIRVAREQSMTIPPITPVDVTEHFRERTFPDAILLNGDPLTNFSQTLETARDTNRAYWGHYQQILIGSCFAALQTPAARLTLARALWDHLDSYTGPRAVNFVLAGLAVPKARALLRTAPLRALTRTALTLLRRRGVVAQPRCHPQLSEAFNFLVAAPLTRTLSARVDGESATLKG